MAGTKRRVAFIVVADLLIALFAFWISRYFSDLPHWYWLVLAAVLWTGASVVTGKLYFSKYRKLWYAMFMLFFMDVLLGLVLHLSFTQWVPDYQYDNSIWIATGIIFLLECGLFHAMHVFVYKKIPYFYESNMDYAATEQIKVIQDDSERPADVLMLLENMSIGTKDPFAAIEKYHTTGTKVWATVDPADLKPEKQGALQLVMHTVTLNQVRHINTLLAATNDTLEQGGYVACKCMPASVRKQLIKGQLPRPLNYVMYFFYYICHRVIPKLPLTKTVYFALTSGKRRALVRVEVLGRLYRAGFDVVSEKIIGEELYVVARKIKEPIRTDKPSIGVLIRLKRKGKNGKQIGVYKFRTMHAYSEYLQPYMYVREGLCNGKYANDYRINSTGIFLRKTFLDELPMLLNWLKGDLKLVGVRPLSEHFFSLYSKELQELRVKTKPGLIPPYYIIKPKSLEDKQNIELDYLHAYFKNPFRTDWSYFWRIFDGIVFKGVRGE